MIPHIKNLSNKINDLQSIRTTGGIASAASGFIVKNTEAATIQRYSVVELVSGLVNPTTNTGTRAAWGNNPPMVNVRKPLTGATNLAIMVQSAAAGKIGRASNKGILKANVNISNTDHTFATISNGSDVLVSATEGEFNLLNCTGGTGEQLAYVSLAGSVAAGGGGSTITIGEVAYGSAENNTDTIDAIFDPPIGQLWDYTKTDYVEGNVAKWADTDSDEYDWVARTGYTYPPSTLAAWNPTKNNYKPGNKVKYGTGNDVRGYTARSTYTYPINPYLPEDPEYNTWEVPPPNVDPANWTIWTDYSPDIDTNNWIKKSIPVKCIIYGTDKLSEALPYFMPKDAILAATVGSNIYFVGFCQKWGTCP